MWGVFLSGRGVKLFPQTLHGVMQQRADIAHGQAGGGGDVAVAEAGFEFQPDKFALAVRQAFHETAEAVGVVFFLQRGGGAGGGVVDVVVEGEGGGGVHGYDAVVFSLVVNDDPAADGEEPWGEALKFAGGRGFEVAEKSVLHGIARGLQVTGVMAGEGEQRALEAVEKF